MHKHSAPGAYPVTVHLDDGTGEKATLSVPPELFEATDAPGAAESRSALCNDLLALLRPPGTPADPPDGDGKELQPVFLTLDPPELRTVEWESLPLPGTGPDSPTGDTLALHPRLRLVRSLLGTGVFRPSTQMEWLTLPVRVLVIGVDPDLGAVQHDDVAVHGALLEQAPRWEVDMLPSSVTADRLRNHLDDVRPQILHIADPGLAASITSGAIDLHTLNLSSTRLVVTNRIPPGDAQDLVSALMRADALDPLLAAVTLWSADGGDHCEPLRSFYEVLGDGSGPDLAARAAVRKGNEHGTPLTAVTTVNCHPDHVLSVPPPRKLELPEDFDPALFGVVDRVPQRREALDWLEHGAGANRVLALYPSAAGGDPDVADANAAHTSQVLWSLVRTWESRPDHDALYLNIGRRDSEDYEDTLLEEELPLAATLVEIVVDGVTSQQGHHTWQVDSELEHARGQIRRVREEYRDAYESRDLKTRQDELLKAGRDLIVKLAPSHSPLSLANHKAPLLLALDRLDSALEKDSDQRPTIIDFFQQILATAPVSIVLTLEDTKPIDWLSFFDGLGTRHIPLKPWPKEAAGPLLREIGARQRIDWHTKTRDDESSRYREKVRESIDEVSDTFGPEHLSSAHSVARFLKATGDAP